MPCIWLHTDHHKSVGVGLAKKELDPGSILGHSSQLSLTIFLFG